MNEFESYLRQLAWELRDLPEDERAEIVAEMRTHIEAGMEDKSVDDTAVSPPTLKAELGSPAELAQNLRGSNWKRNVINASLALIPLLLLNPLNTEIHIQWGYSWQTIVVTSVINILICLGMVVLAYWRRSKLLTGWWLAHTAGALFATYTMPIVTPFNLEWSLLVVILLFTVSGFYGRFLWQNRLDGITITISLIPLLWGMIYLMALRAVTFVIGHWWQDIYTVVISTMALIFVPLIGFLVANRYRQWILLSICCILCTVVIVALWLPNPNAIFWLLLLTPLMLGFSVEMAAYRAFRKTAVSQ